MARDVDAERKQQGMTQHQLAAAAGISQPQVSAVLRGEGAFLVGYLIAWSELIGLPVAEVLRRGEEV